MDNIAEGPGRKGNIEFINFLSYYSGSVCDVNRNYPELMTGIITEEKRKKLSGLS